MDIPGTFLYYVFVSCLPFDEVWQCIMANELQRRPLVQNPHHLGQIDKIDHDLDQMDRTDRSDRS